MKTMYDLIRLAILKKNEVIAYKALDLLKLAFGEQMIRPDESGRIMNLCVVSLREKQYAITDYILDAYRPLIKNGDVQYAGEIVRQLMMVLCIAKKLNQDYLLSKAADCIFEAIPKIADGDENGRIASIDALRMIGLNAIKMNDDALLRETGAMLLALPLTPTPRADERLSLLLSVWMHQIMKQDHPSMLMLFDHLCFSLRDQNPANAPLFTELLNDSNNLVCAVAANSRLQCNIGFIEFLLKLAADSAEDTRIAARTIAKIVQLATELYGLRQGFYLLAPLLERGRSLLNYELKFTMSSSALRKRTLFLYSNELMFLAGLIARQSVRMTDVEVMTHFRDCWLERYHKEINRTSIKQFSQLVVQRMIQRKSVKSG